METITSPLVSSEADSAQLRARLHHFVDETDDLAVLQALLTILTVARPVEASTDSVQFASLPAALRESIEAGLRDSAAGRTRPHAEVWAELKAEFGQA